jgi:hypothetical protein
MSWGEKHASQYVEQNNQIAREIVGSHDGPRGLFKQKSELLSNNKSPRHVANEHCDAIHLDHGKPPAGGCNGVQLRLEGVPIDYLWG